MRLLNTDTKELHEFQGGFTPPYVIFLTYAPGYRKINGCCALARNNSFEWVWIDTCCIDKTSSAELSEAINSMYRWYKEASVCYVYLADVSLPGDCHAENSDFRMSQWFTRGWTLQELVAPKLAEFYDVSWSFIDERSQLRHLIQEITGVPAEFFTGESICDASVAQRMSWAAGRKTTRVEHMAYCLLGLFDVNIPLLYGEGKNAFRRLQEEIIRQSNDETIFAWGFSQPYPGNDVETNDIAALAKWPSDFVDCGRVVPCLAWQPSQTMSFEKIKTGISLELPFVFVRVDTPGRSGVYGILNCRLTDNFSDLIAIPFGPARATPRNNADFYRIGEDLYMERQRHRPPILISEEWLTGSARYKVIVTEDPRLRHKALESQGYEDLASSMSVLTKAAQGLSCFSWQLDPSLELINNNHHVVVVRERRGMSSSLSREAFLYYSRMKESSEDEIVILSCRYRASTTIHRSSEEATLEHKNGKEKYYDLVQVF
ncbi:het domain protein [Seiridium cupressi]